MLKNIDIKLDSALCKCKKSLGWGFDSNNALIIDCKTCGAKLLIPYIELKASIFINAENQTYEPQNQDNVVHLNNYRK